VRVLVVRDGWWLLRAGAAATTPAFALLMFKQEMMACGKHL